MAEADLDVVIRQLAKQQNKGLMAAAKSRRNRYIGLAAKARIRRPRNDISRSRRISCCKELPPPRGCKFLPITPPTVTPGPCDKRQRPSPLQKRSRKQKPDPGRHHRKACRSNGWQIRCGQRRRGAAARLSQLPLEKRARA